MKYAGRRSFFRWLHHSSMRSIYTCMRTKNAQHTHKHTHITIWLKQWRICARRVTSKVAKELWMVQRSIWKSTAVSYRLYKAISPCRAIADRCTVHTFTVLIADMHGKSNLRLGTNIPWRRIFLSFFLFFSVSRAVCFFFSFFAGEWTTQSYNV